MWGTIKTVAICGFTSIVWLASVHAQDEIADVDEIVVYGRAIDMIGEAKSGSQGIVGYADFENRPLLRVGELLEVIPGMVATQHSGTGKANQYFLRGFNLDHGTDFAGFIDGMPINFRTHGHGQGYLDLNFMIPELTERIEFRKGPYFSDVGDFSAAGTAMFKTYDALPASIAEATIGENGFRRGLIAHSVETGNGTLLIAGETAFYDSPFDLDEDLRKFNGFAKFSRKEGAADWSVSLSAYDSEWKSTDQVPLRAIRGGVISRLGFIDPDLGGNTTRIAVNGQSKIDNLNLSAYALYYDFNLFSNFTYFVNDPVNGDEFEQQDERVTMGGASQYNRDLLLAGKPIAFRIGGDVRYDRIFSVGLFNTRDRQRLSTVRDDTVDELSLGAFSEVEIDLTNRLRATVGLRGDFYSYDVDANLTQNSGDGSEGIITPAASLAWRASDNIEFYANYGQGFHSNDVRGAAISVDPVTLASVDPVDVLVRAEGAELGARYERDSFNASLVGFWLTLDSELVFVGDAGTTEPNDGTQRFGVEFNTFWQPTEWIAFDASAAFTDAEFKNAPANMNRIPQAVENVFGAGVSLKPFENFTTTVRLRRFGEAPLIEDGSVSSEPTTVVNLGAYYSFKSVRFGLDVLNVFDSEDADITYFYESRLAGEPSAVEDIHLHPVEPRQIRGSIRIRF